MTDIDKYLSFVMGMFLAFGTTFEVPVAVVVLVKLDMVSIAKLKEVRPYMIVCAFILGALLTPPDVVSQFMLAIPLWLLYEVGVIVAGWMIKDSKSIELKN
jgi:sec-independent protein translocase protein TatC